MKICTGCKVQKPDEAFSLKNGKLRSQCKTCYAAYSRKHYAANKERYALRNKKANQATYQRNKEYLRQYLRNHPCVDCGESDLAVLQFDHIEPLMGGKARPTNYGWCSLVILQERIDECEVRCANCHVRRTRSQFGWLIE